MSRISLVFLSLLPGIVIAGDPADRGVTCTVDGSIVTIVWEIPDNILALAFTVSRDNEVIARLDADERSYRDDAPPGEHTYVVSTNNTINGQLPPDYLIGECTVKVDGEPADGGVTCTVDGSVVTIVWEIPADILVLAFTVSRDNEVIAQLDADERVYRDDAPPGEHTYVVSTNNTINGQRPPDYLIGECTVKVDGEPPLPPPENITCSILESFPVQVDVRWENPLRYEAIIVVRDGAVVKRLPGDATNFREIDPGPGVHLYEVSGVVGPQMSDPASCEAETSGGGRDHLLLRSAATIGGVDPAGVVAHADTLTAVLRNVDSVQGWSFGVCSDPSILTVAETSIEGTTTATLNDGEGPSFNITTTYEKGVTMAVVIDELDTLDTLPVGEHTLIDVRYEPGPDAELGVPYTVGYCDELGEPPVAIVTVVGGFSRTPLTSPGVVSFAPDRFLRGDTNDDGRANMSDGVFVLDWLFRGGREPVCMESADINGSRDIDLADAIYLFQALFSGGTLPPAPYPRCGPGTLFIGCEKSICNDG